jgi:hypothetical protein
MVNDAVENGVVPSFPGLLGPARCGGVFFLTDYSSDVDRRDLQRRHPVPDGPQPGHFSVYEYARRHGVSRREARAAARADTTGKEITTA